MVYLRIYLVNHVENEDDHFFQILDNSLGKGIDSQPSGRNSSSVHEDAVHEITSSCQGASCNETR